MGTGLGTGLRVWLVAVVALGVWALCRYGEARPEALGPDAPATVFSAARADAALGRILGPERPHPISSDENEAVRTRIQAEFAALGMTTRTYRAFTCNSWRGLRAVPCGTVTDIIADVVPGEGPAILLLAHYDSVPAGPGASDDESGVATILETARALQARGGRSRHPVLALLTDGEEAGLLGANAFLQNPQWKRRAGIAINVEARGTRGRSLLFQTSPGDGRLIDLYARSVPHYATSSLYAEIYKYLPNDTDLTLFLRAGIPAFNFAFADNVAYYHSPFDRRAAIDPRTLQEHGDNMLGVASALEQTDTAALKGGNDVYLSILGLFLPRLPAALALPLALIALLVIAGSAFATRTGRIGRRGWALAAAMPMLLVLGAGLAGWALSTLAVLISGHPDPGYAHPGALRAVLALAVWLVALLLLPLVNRRSAAFAAWGWMAALAVVTAIFLPGVSPYFLFPALVAAALAPLWARGRGGTIALGIAALASLVIWTALVAQGETLMGLRMHPLFTVPAAFALLALMPLLAQPKLTRKAWLGSAGFSATLALILTVVAGLEPAYSPVMPQRIDLAYFESDAAKGARWIADTAWKGIGIEPIPPALASRLRPVADAYPGLASQAAYSAPAGPALYPLPRGMMVSDIASGGVHRIALSLHGSPALGAMLVRIPGSARLQAIDIRGQHLAAPKDRPGGTLLTCAGRDCRDLDLTLTLGAPATIQFAEERFALPPTGAAWKALRPASAMASQSGDVTILANSLKLP